MAVLNSTEIAKVFKICRLPQSGTAFVAFRLTSLYGPSGEPYNFSYIVTALNAILAATTDDQNTFIRALLLQWDNNNLDFNEIEILADGGTIGTLQSMDKQRAGIRRTLGDIIGFAIPTGGFMAEVERASNSGPRLVR